MASLGQMRPYQFQPTRLRSAFQPLGKTLITPSRVSTKVQAFNKVSLDVATKSLDELSQLEITTLKEALEKSVKSEDYTTAARIRDAIAVVEQKDPLLSLQMELDAAIKEERYGDAALLRDQLKDLLPPPPEPPTTTSTRITEGIRVTVEAFYDPISSRPEANNYLFAYKIKITNEAHPTTVKLVSRRWIISDSRGRVREVQGQGVIGEFPELAPGESFEYQSGCPLATKEGSMEGEYEFYSRVSPSDSWSTSFLVYIARFALSVEGPRLL